MGGVIAFALVVGPVREFLFPQKGRLDDLCLTPRQFLDALDCQLVEPLPLRRSFRLDEFILWIQGGAIMAFCRNSVGVGELKMAVEPPTNVQAPPGSDCDREANRVLDLLGITLQELLEGREHSLLYVFRGGAARGHPSDRCAGCSCHRLAKNTQAGAIVSIATPPAIVKASNLVIGHLVHHLEVDWCEPAATPWWAISLGYRLPPCT
jgi:hypothetical protein